MKSDKHRAEQSDGGAADENTSTTAQPPQADKPAAGADNNKKKSPPAEPASNKAAKDAKPSKDKAAPPDAAEQPPPVPPRPSRTGTVLASLSLIMVIAAVGGGYVFWGQYTHQQQQLDKRLDDVQQTASAAEKSAGDVQDSLGSLNSSVDALKTSVQSMNDKLTSQLNTALGDIQTKEQALRESVQKLHDKLDRNSDDWVVAEAEYLIRVADQRLQLTRDTHTAVRALENADQRLRDMGDPSLLEVRKKITDDIVALRAVPDPDIEGMALTLSGLAQRVDVLPLTGGPAEHTMPDTAEAKGDAAPTSGWRGFVNRLWGQIKTLVVIQHKGAGGKPLLPPDERYFLRENLRLKLESARLALLRHDNKTFSDVLGTAGKWLTDYFDPQSQAVISMQDSLKELAGTELTPKLPDVSDALKALHDWKSKHAAKAAADNGAVPGRGAASRAG